jgi:hypothetical protein
VVVRVPDDLPLVRQAIGLAADRGALCHVVVLDRNPDRPNERPPAEDQDALHAIVEAVADVVDRRADAVTADGAGSSTVENAPTGGGSP